MKIKKIKPTPFLGRPGPESTLYNASELVALDDSRFLFCDNNVGDALFEINLTSEGGSVSPVRRLLDGIARGSVDDLEGLTMAEIDGHQFIIAIPSLSLKQRKKQRTQKSKRGKKAPARNGLLRITLGAQHQLKAEVIPDFRSWLIRETPLLDKSPRYLPDDGGLNVEAVCWDPKARSLLVGLRTPVIDGQPLILRVRVETDSPWESTNLEMLEPIQLAIEDEGDEQGIRSISYDPSRETFLVVVGNSTSSSKAPFSLYSWDGNQDGVVRRFGGIRFSKKMRVEGVSPGYIEGRRAIVFIDDAGGYAFCWDDNSLLQE